MSSGLSASMAEVLKTTSDTAEETNEEAPDFAIWALLKRGVTATFMGFFPLPDFISESRMREDVPRATPALGRGCRPLLPSPPEG